jgi:Tol biopolymer transport system component
MEAFMRRSSFVYRVSVTVAICLAIAFAVLPASATFPGKNGRIVFVANPSGSWQVYTIKPDGSDMKQVTTLAPTALEFWGPNYSPDGKIILFTYGQLNSNGVCQCDLYMIHPDGTGLTNLTNDGVSDFGHWSPDGTHIVFYRINSVTQGLVITTMRADGTGKKEALTNPDWSSVGNAYTPDGKQIVMDSNQGGLVSALWTMNTQGKEQKRITAAYVEGCLADVSPSGQRVLIVNHCNSNVPSVEIFQADLTGKHLQQLTYPPKGKIDLAWGYSPDGKKIVFVSNRMSSNQSLDLYTADADGTNIRRIASGLTVGGCPDGNCVTPSWGPKANHEQ